MPTPSKIRYEFYRSRTWFKVRSTKVKEARGLCEICGERGSQVHHIIPLTDSNVNDPEIAISLSNLQLLCVSCHNMQRNNMRGLRRDYLFDDKGDMYFAADDKS